MVFRPGCQRCGDQADAERPSSLQDGQRPDPYRRLDERAGQRSLSGRCFPSPVRSGPRPLAALPSGSRGSLNAWARSRRSSSIRARIVAKSSAARGLVTFPPLADQRHGSSGFLWEADERLSSLAYRPASKQVKIRGLRQCLLVGRYQSRSDRFQDHDACVGRWFSSPRQAEHWRERIVDERSTSVSKGQTARPLLIVDTLNLH
jgi:hypothetical protein